MTNMRERTLREPVIVIASLLVILATGSVYVQKVKDGTVSTCVGKHVYSSQDLRNVAMNTPSGTTYCIHDGHYSVYSNIQVQSGDTFWGVYSDSSRPTISTNHAEYIFYTSGTYDATIKNLTVKGAVGGNYCEPDCGRGIGGGGENLTVDNVRATQNANQGIGGTDKELLVINSTLDHNGSYSFTRDGGAVSSAGIKSVNSMTILNSRIIDNYWVGIWCDLECGALKVKDSVLSGNGKAGISDEISSGPAVIVNNTIKNNGTLYKANRHTGLLIVDSQNVEAYGNTFEGNIEYGVEVAETGRSPGIGNVSMYHNTMKGDPSRGCDLSGVSCLDLSYHPGS